jgi:hypothetical protein
MIEADAPRFCSLTASGRGESFRLGASLSDSGESFRLGASLSDSGRVFQTRLVIRIIWLAPR